MHTFDPVQDAIRRLEQKFNDLGSRLTQRVYDLEQAIKAKAGSEAEPEIVPCPFCGESQVSILYWEAKGLGTKYAQECLVCGARGPSSSKGEESSVEYWNNRRYSGCEA